MSEVQEMGKNKTIFKKPFVATEGILLFSGFLVSDSL